MTGVNRGQITEIMECREGRYADDQVICADGGIRSPGDAAKAFGAGADYVMLGGYWKNAKEAQNIIDGEFKFWGGASKYQQVKQKGEVKRHSEGKVLSVEEQPVSLEELINDLWGGISSAVSYSGFATLSNFIGNGVFELKHN
jgi:GMP reductase